MSTRCPTFRSIADLAAAGLVNDHNREALKRVADRFAVALSPHMAEQIDHADPQDPIARQFVPAPEELRIAPEERPDPIGDETHSPVQGVVHRYSDRVLLKLVTACAVYCRFCFRREMVGPGHSAMLPAEALDKALEYIASDPRIWEVILTGGDPLILSARRLREVMQRLAGVGHVKVVRVHSRVPAVAPERITPAIVRALLLDGTTTYVALHANHPRELTETVRTACERLIDAGIPMVSQTVLLKGVNDDPDTLAALMRRFVEFRIKPYYLHHCDLAPGTAHFRVPLAQGRKLVQALNARVSGLCQPSYVLDIPGGYGKVPVGPSCVEEENDGAYRVIDPGGRAHPYRDIV